ncbi:MAG TPA: 50S ribosomal protein L24 [Candidatus Krumholzibacteriaceae bacterium]|nr:50S ribosomal protein L24 [Candidatus Krumholzibacteriaceae bacterium]
MVAVTKPGLQRKRLFQAPLHLRYKQFAAPLSPELKKSNGFNALPLRKGDTVRVMRGDRKGIEGKVSKVDRKKYRISVEGITREKVDGTAIPVLIHPSKVMIINLNLDDKWRRDLLNRKKAKAKGEATEKPAKAEEKKPKKKKAKKPKTRKVAEAKEEPEKKKTKRRTKKKAKKEEEEKETEGE